MLPRMLTRSEVINFALLMCVTTLLLFTGDTDAARKTSANRECAICHIMWLDEFKQKDVTTLVDYEPLPVEKSGKQDVASTDKMCFSCHDGFVLDSRFLWKKQRHNHPVGVIPSDDVTIPTANGKTIFPMNKDGKLYCGSCHTAHGVDWNQKNTPIFMRMENTNSNLCMACHLNRATGSRKGNHPVHKKLKNIPDSLLKAGSKFSENKEVICQSCHVVHGSKQRKILAKPNQNSELCTSCHAQKGNVRNTKHDLSSMVPSPKNTLGQEATDSGPCSACHTPHKARGPRLWSRDLTTGNDLSSAYCLSCHKPDGIAHEKTIGKHSHPVDIPLRRVGVLAKKEGWTSRVKNKAAPKNIVKLPLFEKSGKEAKEGGNVTCLTCHDPHQWQANHHQKVDDQLSKLKTKNKSEIKADGSNSFLRIPNNKNSDLCRNCHRDKAPVAFSKHNLGISAPDEKNKKGMNVAHNGVCSACHNAHNGTSEKMWAKTVSGSSKGAMPKCLSCHEKGSVAENESIGKHSHPMHVSPKKIGATTDLPLFNKDGKRDDKHGLIDCTTCHNPHQWDALNPIAKSGLDPKKEGSANNSFLRRKASGNASLCVNCHKKKSSVIGTDHDLSITGNESRNIALKTAKQSGPCGQCHTMHKAVLPERLWAQNLGQGKFIAEKLCTGCHRRGGAGNEKVPFELLHPPRILSVFKGGGGKKGSGGKQVKTPLFTAKGESAEIGMISCLTCHNPHQWRADSSKPGTGENVEGDVLSSFLRHSGTEFFLCANCHGEESLYRYKYFHWPQSRSDKGLQ